MMRAPVVGRPNLAPKFDGRETNIELRQRVIGSLFALALVMGTSERSHPLGSAASFVKPSTTAGALHSEQVA
jgi:hypothetical protein